jgi:RimJ/RimL family protein N-acetyltransferase
MSTWPQTIETERLTLAFPTPADAPDIFERYAQDEEVTRYLSWTTHKSLDETHKFLQNMIDFRESGTSIIWLIRDRATGQLLGAVGVRPAGPKAELGYCLAQDAWGHGYAVEAARAAINAAFQEESIWRVQAHCDIEAVRSQRVLEKLGMTCEGVLRRHSLLPNRSPEPRDMICYAVTRDEL